VRRTRRVFEAWSAIWILILVQAALLSTGAFRIPPAFALSDEAVEELLKTAEKALEEDRYTEAIAIYRQVLRDYPETAFRDRLHIKLAESFQKNHDPGGAAATLERFLDEFPDSGEVESVLNSLTDLYIELGNLQKAGAALERQRSIARDVGVRRQITMRLINVLIDRGEPVEAIESLLQAAQDAGSLQDEEGRLELRRRIENMILELKAPELSRLMDLHQGDYPADRALLRLADLEEEKGYLFEADRELNRFLVFFPEHPEVDAVYARLFGIKQRLLEYRFLIGVLLPQGEKYQPYVEQILNGVRLAVDRFIPPEPLSAGGKFVGFVIRSTEGDEKQIGRSFEELVDEYKIVGVIGPLLSQDLERVAKQAGRFGIPAISPSASRDVLPVSGGLLFRNSITLREQGRFIANYAMIELGFSRFCILYPEDVYGKTLMRAFRDEVLKNSGEIIAVESYPADSRDVGQQIRRIKKEDMARYGTMEAVPDSDPPAEKYVPGFDAIYLPGDYDRVGLIASQLAFYDLADPVLLGSNGWNSRDLIRIGGEYVEGGIFVDGFFAGSEEPAVREFVTAYAQRYGKEPALLGSQAYDSTMLLLQGLAGGAQSPALLRSYLESITDFPGAAGTYQSLPGGILSRALRVIRVEEGRFVQVH
jgi:branched-chain amino acid transport system substrate-binding protein